MYEEFNSCKIIKCATGFKVDTTNNKCIVDVVCHTGLYNNNGVCYKCPAGKYDGGGCMSCNSVANVFDLNSYDSNCKVTKCKPGYYLNNIDNICTSNCSSGYTLNGDNCIIDNICFANKVNINNICTSDITSYITEYIFTNCGATGRLGPTLN
jgi:hypothetical protein